MIIQVAGTSGNGKSTVVRHLLTHMRDTEKVMREGRRTPIGYRGGLGGVDGELFVVGTYEAPTGGCDTIKDVNLVFDLVAAAHNAGQHVIFEGLFVMNHTRGLAMARSVGASQVRIIHLDTPLEECLRRIDARRSERGNGPLLSRKNTEGNYVRARNYVQKMRYCGVGVLKCTTDHAKTALVEMMTCPSQ